MRARLTAAMVLAALSTAALPVSALAGTTTKAMWGPVSDFPVYHALGVGIYETNLDWGAAAPTRPRNPSNPSDPAYRWSPGIDYAIKQAARYHMRVLLQVGRTPSWANGGRAASYPPSRPSDLASFLTAAARRYPSVHLWMIWGEPNHKVNLPIFTN